MEEMKQSREEVRAEGQVHSTVTKFARDVGHICKEVEVLESKLSSVTKDRNGEKPGGDVPVPEKQLVPLAEEIKGLTRQLTAARFKLESINIRLEL